MRRVILALGALALAAVVAVGLGSAGGGGDEPESPPALAEQLAQLEGAPAPLAALHDQANEILGGGAEAFRQRLEQLKGHPVVVNKWASWCGPCRVEFPHFARQAVKHGREVAFIGVDTNDNREDARRFLDEFPVTYPHYDDPDYEVAAVFKGVAAFPTTAFYDSNGELAYLKQGQYLSEEDLARDIERYAK